MADDLGKAINSLPGWVIPVTVGGVVLVALFSRGGGHSSPGYTSVVYGPTPSDPGLVGLAASEVSAKQSVVQTLINALISRDISSIGAERDLGLAGINASVANQRTAASEALGMAQSDNATRAAIFQAQTAGQIVNSQGATAKYIARQGKESSIWGDITKGITSIASAVIPKL